MHASRVCCARMLRRCQALLRPARRCPCGSSRAAPGRLQLYVDDPVLTLAGTSAEADLAIDLVLLWWLCLGPPLAWRKGTCGTAAHRWIGGIFDVRLTAAAPEAVQALVGDASRYVVVSVPEDFAAALSEGLNLFLGGAAHIAEEVVQRAVGRCSRLAYLVPAARPFVAAMWGALAAAQHARGQGAREAPPGSFPAQRFSHAARWLHRLLHPPARSEPWLPLEHVVSERLQQITLATAVQIEVDASPWGAVLFFVATVLCRGSGP